MKPTKQWTLIANLMFILTLIIGAISHADAGNLPDTDMSTDAIEARIAPVGKVRTAAEPQTSSTSSSVTPVSTNSTTETAATAGTTNIAELYQQKCALCHAAGLAGAPLKGDAAAWKPRLAKGMDALLTSVKNGLNAMPAMGNCPECSDEDFKQLINYMTAP
ncbi:MAG: hypothetical protein Tsb005_04140 [Gammaproteobacteria bacterium]